MRVGSHTLRSEAEDIPLSTSSSPSPAWKDGAKEAHSEVEHSVQLQPPPPPTPSRTWADGKARGQLGERGRRRGRYGIPFGGYWQGRNYRGIGG